MRYRRVERGRTGISSSLLRLADWFRETSHDFAKALTSAKGKARLERNRPAIRFSDHSYDSSRSSGVRHRHRSIRPISGASYTIRRARPRWEIRWAIYKAIASLSKVLNSVWTQNTNGKRELDEHGEGRTMARHLLRISLCVGEARKRELLIDPTRRRYTRPGEVCWISRACSGDQCRETIEPAPSMEFGHHIIAEDEQCWLGSLKLLVSILFVMYYRTSGSKTRIEPYVQQYQQDDWVDWLPIAQMAHMNRTSTSTGVSPFFFTHGYNGSIVEATEDVLLNKDNKTLRTPAGARAQALVSKIKESTAFALAAMAVAQEAQEMQANRMRQIHNDLKPDDGGYLNLKNWRTDRPSKKLDWIATPYRVIERVGTHGYKLDTPPGVHPVFHISLLKRRSDDPLPSQPVHHTENPPIKVDGQDVYKVESILGHRRRGKGFQYNVKWLDWSRPTWEPAIEPEHLDKWKEYVINHPECQRRW